MVYVGYVGLRWLENLYDLTDSIQEPQYFNLQYIKYFV